MPSTHRKKNNNSLPLAILFLVIVLASLILYSPSNLEDTTGRLLGFPFFRQLASDGQPVTKDILASLGFSSSISPDGKLLSLENAQVSVAFQNPISLDPITPPDFRLVIMRQGFTSFPTHQPHFRNFEDVPATITFRGITYIPDRTLLWHYGDDGTKRICSECVIIGFSRTTVAFFAPRGFSGYGISNPSPPQQQGVTLTPSTSPPYTSAALTCTPIGTFDPDGDPVVDNAYFILNGANFALVAMTFDVNVSTPTPRALHDFSGNSFRGTLGGGNPSLSPQWVGLEGSKKGGAYLFDGVDDYINLGADIFDSAWGATFEAWVNLTSNDDYSVVFASGGAQNGYAMGTHDGSGSIFFGARKSGTLFTVTYPASSLSLNTYHHLAGVHDGATQQLFLYLNGVRVATAPGPGFMPVVSAPNALYSVGADKGSDLLNLQQPSFLTGTIDELYIFNRTLSPAQIQKHYTLQYSVIDAAETTKGDTWQCVNTPTDGYYLGNSHQSAALTILNAPPTHNPPLLRTPGGAAYDSEDLLCAHQNAQDLDQDPVNFIYGFVLDDLPIHVANLPFEIGPAASSRTADYSLYSNNGTVMGATFAPSGGILGGAYLFDGINDLITIPSHSSLDIDGDFSADFWVNFGSFSNHTPLLMRGSSLVNVFRTNYGIRTGGNLTNTSVKDIEFVFDTGGTRNVYSTTGVQLQPLTFYHIGVIKPYGASPSIYVNGALKNGACKIGTCSAPLESYAEPLILGRARIKDSFHHFNGTLDEVRVYDLPLTSTQFVEHTALRYDRIMDDMTLVGDRWKCAVTPFDIDEAGLTKTSNTLNIIASNGVSGGSGGQPSSGQQAFHWFTSLQNTVTYNLQSNWEVHVHDIGSTEYEITLAGTNYHSGTLTLLIAPSVGSFSLREGDVEPIDLDDDGEQDISITAESIGYNRATLTFALASASEPQGTLPSSGHRQSPPVAGKRPTTEQPTTPVHIVEEGFVEKPSAIPYRGLAIILLVILIIATLAILGHHVRPPQEDDLPPPPEEF